MRPLEVTTVPANIEKPDPKPVLPNPKDIHTSPVKWLVITHDRLPEGTTWVYYGVTPEQYEVMSRNMAEILRWVREARWRLEYYRGEGNIDGPGNEGVGGISGGSGG